MSSPFSDSMLGRAVPKRIRGEIAFPRRLNFHPSPADWRD